MKTSTKNVIITGIITLICSIISIIGTKSYISLQQEQTQSQTQNQIITLNINGKEVSYQSQDVESLNEQITLLESKNRTLEEINEDLKNQKESIADINLYDYNLFINGVQQSITNKNSVIEYNTNTYIRYDIVSLLDSNVTMDKVNNKIIKGIDLGQTCLLMKECPPYETSGVFSTNPFTIQGETYSNGFVIFTSDYRDILFNLKNDYSSLEFDIGHIDESGDYMCIINFYVDDEYIKTITKNPQDNITHEVIPLNYGKILKMEVLTKKEPTASPMCAKYGLSNMILVQ